VGGSGHPPAYQWPRGPDLGSGNDFLSKLQANFERRPTLTPKEVAKAADPLRGALARLQKSRPDERKDQPSWVLAQFDVARDLQTVDPGEPEATLAIAACSREWLAPPEWEHEDVYVHNHELAEKWLGDEG
jgi:hypothetical protein